MLCDTPASVRALFLSCRATYGFDATHRLAITALDVYRNNMLPCALHTNEEFLRADVLHRRCLDVCPPHDHPQYIPPSIGPWQDAVDAHNGVTNAIVRWCAGMLYSNSISAGRTAQDGDEAMMFSTCVSLSMLTRVCRSCYGDVATAATGIIPAPRMGTVPLRKEWPDVSMGERAIRLTNINPGFKCLFERNPVADGSMCPLAPREYWTYINDRNEEVRRSNGHIDVTWVCETCLRRDDRWGTDTFGPSFFTDIPHPGRILRLMFPLLRCDKSRSLSGNKGIDTEKGILHGISWLHGAIQLGRVVDAHDMTMTVSSVTTPQYKTQVLDVEITDTSTDQLVRTPINGALRQIFRRSKTLDCVVYLQRPIPVGGGGVPVGSIHWRKQYRGESLDYVTAGTDVLPRMYVMSNNSLLRVCGCPPDQKSCTRNTSDRVVWKDEDGTLHRAHLLRIVHNDRVVTSDACPTDSNATTVITRVLSMMAINFRTKQLESWNRGDREFMERAEVEQCMLRRAQSTSDLSFVRDGDYLHRSMEGVALASLLCFQAASGSRGTVSRSLYKSVVGARMSPPYGLYTSDVDSRLEVCTETLLDVVVPDTKGGRAVVDAYRKGGRAGDGGWSILYEHITSKNTSSSACCELPHAVLDIIALGLEAEKGGGGHEANRRVTGRRFRELDQFVKEYGRMQWSICDALPCDSTPFEDWLGRISTPREEDGMVVHGSPGIRPGQSRIPSSKAKHLEWQYFMWIRHLTMIIMVDTQHPPTHAAYKPRATYVWKAVRDIFMGKWLSSHRYACSTLGAGDIPGLCVSLRTALDGEPAALCVLEDTLERVLRIGTGELGESGRWRAHDGDSAEWCVHGRPLMLFTLCWEAASTHRERIPPLSQLNKFVVKVANGVSRRHLHGSRSTNIALRLHRTPEHFVRNLALYYMTCERPSVLYANSYGPRILPHWATLCSSVCQRQNNLKLKQTERSIVHTVFYDPPVYPISDIRSLSILLTPDTRCSISYLG